MIFLLFLRFIEVHEMIVDHIKNVALYAGVSSRLKIALDYLASVAEKGAEPGEFEVDGKNIYGFCREFQLRSEEDMPFEAHRKYIDIHYVVKGREKICCAALGLLQEEKAYSEEVESGLYRCTHLPNRIVLNPGEFAVFFQEDGHKPYCSVEGEISVTKIMMKVLV